MMFLRIAIKLSSQSKSALSNFDISESNSFDNLLPLKLKVLPSSNHLQTA